MTSLRGHTGLVTWCACSPVDTNRVASASIDRSVKIWDVSTTDCLTTLVHAASVLCCAYSANGERIVSVSDDNVIRIWDLSTELEVILPHSHTGLFPCLFGPGDMSVIAGSANGDVLVWDVVNGQYILRVHPCHDGPIRGMAITKTVLASTAYDMTVVLCQLDTGAYEDIAHAYNYEDFDCCAVSPDGRFLAVGANDRTVRVIDLVTKQSCWQTDHLDECIHTCKFSSTGQYLITGSRKSIQIWQDAICVRTIGHADNMGKFDISADSSTLIVSTGHRLVIYNVADEISEHSHQ